MEIAEDTPVTVELMASGGADELLLTAFTDEGIEIDGVWGEIKKSAGIEPVVHYVVTLLLQSPSNLAATAEGAIFTLVLQKAKRAIKKINRQRPDADGELSIRRSEDPHPKRLFNYVMPIDPEELQLALDAVAEDMARSTPPVEKWWRHGHGWLTAEEGRKLDGYNS